MKLRSISPAVIICFLLALIFITVGLVGGVAAFHELESLALSHEQHENPVIEVRASTMRLLWYGGSVVLGISVLVILLLCMLQ